MSFETFTLVFVLASVFVAGGVAALLARWICTPMPPAVPPATDWDALDRHLADQPAEVLPQRIDHWVEWEKELAS